MSRFLRRLFGYQPSERELRARLERIHDNDRNGRTRQGGARMKSRDQIIDDAMRAVFDGSFDGDSLQDALHHAATRQYDDE